MDTVLHEMKVEEYLDLLGSNAPAPGGGAAAAFSAAQGCALAQMVCELTKGRKKYAESQELAENASETLASLRSSLLSLMEEDAQGYQGFMDVLAMPKSSEDEIIYRKAAMEMALRECTKTPFRIMLLADEALQLVDTLVGRTNANAASDLACAALNLKSALQAAWLNVRVNTASLSDRNFATQYEKDGQAILARTLPLADRIEQTVRSSIG